MATSTVTRTIIGAAVVTAVAVSALLGAGAASARTADLSTRSEPEARAVVSPPKLLILDEPTSASSPQRWFTSFTAR